MTEKQKIEKVPDLEQEPQELTPEQAEETKGGIIIDYKPVTERGVIINWSSPSLGGPDT